MVLNINQFIDIFHSALHVFFYIIANRNVVFLAFYCHLQMFELNYEIVDLSKENCDEAIDMTYRLSVK